MVTLTIEDVSRALEGRYRDLRAIGGGGQARVFRARRVSTKERSPADDDVALKLFSRPSEVERIEREVSMMSRVRHPTVANLIEFGTVTITGGVLRFVASEFIEGTPLDKRLQQGPLGGASVAAIGRDVATAIGEIWRERIVHRDIGPKNIMLRTGEREAVLIDLGIAKSTAEAPITTQGVVWGTSGYMSPEQWEGVVELTSASDVFALGVTMLEALAAKHPTDRDQHSLCNDRIVVADIVPAAPAGLATLIQRMLSLRASFRPPPAQIAERCSTLSKTLS